MKNYLVDICGGTGTLAELSHECDAALAKNPKRFKVTSYELKDGRYRFTIYIDKTTFERGPRYLGRHGKD